MVPVKQLVYDDVMDFILVDVNDVLWLDVWHSLQHPVDAVPVLSLVTSSLLDSIWIS